MKTNFRLKNRYSNNKNYKRTLIALIVFFLGAFMLIMLKSTVFSLGRPVWMSKRLPFNNIWLSLRAKDSLIEENQRLRDRIIDYQSQQEALKLALDREAHLINLLGRKRETDGIMASVLVYPPQMPYDFLLVDAGSSEGIEINDEVVTPEGALLGVIIETSKDVSKVKLHTTSGERINAILERNAVPVIMLGNGGGNFMLKLPRDMAIEVGDKILGPSINSPLLGVVSDISMNPTDSTKEVIAKGPVNIFNVRYVLIK